MPGIIRRGGRLALELEFARTADRQEPKSQCSKAESISRRIPLVSSYKLARSLARPLAEGTSGRVRIARPISRTARHAGSERRIYECLLLVPVREYARFDYARISRKCSVCRTRIPQSTKEPEERYCYMSRVLSSLCALDIAAIEQCERVSSKDAVRFAIRESGASDGT